LKTLVHALIALLAASSVSAQLITDTLVADINSAPFTVGSYSGAIASDDQRVFFRGVDQASGESYRVWCTDGTTAGTVQLTTMATNVHEAAFAADGTLFMIIDELGLGVTLWSSDGTQAGTVELLPPQAWTVDPHDLVAFDGAVWFLAGTASTGVELWKSDPVTGITALAAELGDGILSGAEDLLASATHLFVGVPGGITLLAGDGTQGSFVPVANLVSSDSGTFDKWAPLGNRVVFNVSGFGASAGWWVSDGTAAGTLRIHTSFNDFWAVAADTKVYFTAGGVSVPALWETDGTLAGTLAVDDATSTGGQRVSFLYPGLAIGDEFFFGGFVAGKGFEPSRTMGAAAGSQIIHDVNTGALDSDPSDFVLHEGRVFFRADDGVHGREIWSLILATGQTRLVGDLFPGPAAGIPGTTGTLAVAEHGVVFGQTFEDVGMEPAVTDGVQTGLLLNIAHDGLSAGSGPVGFVRLGNNVLFQATEEATGAELWASDGTTAGTHLVADIDPSASGFGSAPRHLVRYGDRVVFFAGTPATGRELWITDGTAAGTTLVADLVPGPGSSEPLFSAPPVVLDDKLYAILRLSGGSLGLFETDGTAAGTGLVLITDSAGALAEFVVLEKVGERLVFNANLAGGLELWTSDGTAAGSEILVDATPGGDSFFTRIFPGDTVAYFSTTLGNDHRIWRTDGTPVGTEIILTDTNPAFLEAPVIQATFGDGLVFTQSTPGFGVEPWFTEGTPGGEIMLADIEPGEGSSRSVEFVTSGDRMYFAVESPPGSFHFQQVWSTDGTPAGTGMVVELPSPVAGAGVGDFWSAGNNGELVFSNVDANGEEWWITDGTEAGTRALTDIAPGPAFAEPRPGILLGDTMIFMANDGDNGPELHALPLEETEGYGVTALGDACPGANGAPQLTLDGGSPSVGESFTLGVSSANPGTLVFWAFDFGFGSHSAPGTCDVQLALPQILLSTPADGAGEASITLDVPSAASLAGLVVDFQSFSSEPGGPFLNLGTLTNVLEIVVGP
jgi:ELWxxDGT repeat protein